MLIVFVIISFLSPQLFFLRYISSSSVRQVQFFFAEQYTARRFFLTTIVSLKLYDKEPKTRFSKSTSDD